MSVTLVFHIIGDSAIIRNSSVCDNPESRAVANLAERMALHDLSRMGVKNVQFGDGHIMSITNALQLEALNLGSPLAEGPL